MQPRLAWSLTRWLKKKTAHRPGGLWTAIIPSGLAMALWAIPHRRKISAEAILCPSSGTFPPTMIDRFNRAMEQSGFYRILLLADKCCY
jgi:hypothetical protein